MTSTDPAQRETLGFKDDPGASRSAWLAAGISAALVLWMASGVVFPSETDDGPQESAEALPVLVAVRHSVAEPVTVFFEAEGVALPDRDTSVRAETSGTVRELLVRVGSDVSEGDVIARNAPERLEAAVRSAEETRDRAQREFDNATALLERGVATVDRVAEARTALASAESQLVSAQEALADGTITAPFDGRIEALPMELGEFIAAGTEVARIVDHDPLTVSIDVPQQSAGRVRAGQVATVEFLTGQSREGEVTFVSTTANAATRTFDAEIEVKNEGVSIPAGLSVRVRIPTETTEGHFVSSSELTLNDAGEMGIKTVTPDNTVEFHAVTLVSADLEGVWVAGLPETADIIATGQGYVAAGEPVRTAPFESDPS